MDAGSRQNFNERFRAEVRRIVLETGNGCRTAAEHFGFDYFHLGFRAMLAPGVPVQVFVDGGPRTPHPAYGSRQWLFENPVLTRALNSAVPFDWRENLSSTETGKSLIERWGRLGMAHGVAVPLHTRSAYGLMLFSGDAALPRPGHLRTELFRELHWCLAQLFESALQAINRAWSGSERRRLLTTRQRKALVLAADGRPLSAVASALGVHASTARYLLMRGSQKLGAQTREQALVRFAAGGALDHHLFPSSIDESDFLVMHGRAVR